MDLCDISPSLTGLRVFNEVMSFSYNLLSQLVPGIVACCQPPWSDIHLHPLDIVNSFSISRCPLLALWSLFFIPTIKL